MKEVFADTGYWIALFDPKDELHEKAKAVSQSLGQVIIVTSEMVLTEFANYFARRGSEFPGQLSPVLSDGLRNEPNVRLQFGKRVLSFSPAFTLYRNYLGPGLEP